MAHALNGYDGQCKNIHGHTYHLSVTIKGNIIHDVGNSKNGMVLDFTDLKEIVKTNILDKFDHSLVLNGKTPHLDFKNVLIDEFEKNYLFRRTTNL